MAESRTDTGSRDDLVLDVSRCLRMRFSESGCRRCVDICPHGAILLDGGLAINPEQCHGCLLCTSVCPVGAMEQNNDFYTCLANLAKVPEPILGCTRTKDCSNAIVSCLGGLAEEHILALYHSLAGRLTLNLSLCSDCPNSDAITTLKRRMETLSAARLSYGNCRIEIAESPQDIHFRDESVDRRSFFKSFSTLLFSSAAVILSTTNEQTDRRTEYSGKRVPLRRTLLNSVRDNASHELVPMIRRHFDSGCTFDENCSTCNGCVAICPTGALDTEESDLPPTFDQLLCTGCQLCTEFCVDGAVRIASNGIQE